MTTGLVAGLGTLWVARAALDAMTREADRVSPSETGGVLMGYWTQSPTGDVGGEGAVAAVIGPGPRAVHRKWAFVPDHEYQEAEIERIYEACGRRWTYLGDWHTHPDGPALLSNRDRTTLRRIATAEDARAPHPVMVLLAGGRPWRPCAWAAHVGPSRLWRPRALVTRPLHLRPFDE